MNWFAYQISAAGRREAVAFDENPKLTPTMAKHVVWESLRPIPDHLREATLAELVAALAEETP